MKTIQITDEDYEFLKDLQHELNTQTNDGNADPVYWGVIETREEPVPEDYGEARFYNCDGDCSVMTLNETVEWVDENIEDEDLAFLWDTLDHEDLDTVFLFIHDKMGIGDAELIEVEERSFISRETGAFLTKRACQEYICRYGYNHSRPHTYAMTAYRNYELAQLLKILRTMEMKED